ncbi:MAG: 1-(5-phosphoribosyl)-5-[(5-phosphoribosylamino)methylideneamino]imidazole-4-carboxamide isomerase [Bacteroidota bacterium]
MTIIPAIDLINGCCVRLTQGDYHQQKTYNSNPVEVALAFEKAGIKRLHVVDLDGAKQGRLINLPVLKAIADTTNLIIDFGGGIKTQEDVEQVLEAGAAMATIGSIAVKQPALVQEWIRLFGANKILLGADVLNGTIRVNGWQQDSGIQLFNFLNEMLHAGITQFFCTDISKDGLLQGPAITLYQQIKEKYPQLFCIASGGVSNFNDLVLLKAAGCDAAIVGKAFYEGHITLDELIQIENES